MNVNSSQKGSIAFLIIFVLLLVGAFGFLSYRYRSPDTLVADLSNRLFGKSILKTTASPVTATASSVPNIYIYRGKVLKITEDSKKWYTVILQPQDESGKNKGDVLTFKIPEAVPLTNSSTLGKTFKEMIDKGFNPINIKITYDEKRHFSSWESLAIQK